MDKTLEQRVADLEQRLGEADAINTFLLTLALKANSQQSAEAIRLVLMHPVAGSPLTDRMRQTLTTIRDSIVRPPDRNAVDQLLQPTLSIVRPATPLPEGDYEPHH
jgi:hypothetical protein